MLFLAMETASLGLWDPGGAVLTWPPRERGGDRVLLMEMDRQRVSDALTSRGVKSRL